MISKRMLVVAMLSFAPKNVWKTQKEDKNGDISQ